MPYKQFLGYEKGEDGKPVIVPEEAEIVRLIYRLFLYGKSASYIASLLTDEGIPTPGGKTQWRSNVMLSILQKDSSHLRKHFIAPGQSATAPTNLQ